MNTDTYSPRDIPLLRAYETFEKLMLLNGMAYDRLMSNQGVEGTKEYRDLKLTYRVMMDILCDVVDVKEEDYELPEEPMEAVKKIREYIRTGSHGFYTVGQRKGWFVQ